MKRKWTLCPVNIWDAETMERWLEDEAARGWRLDGSRQWSDRRVRFLRTEPAACRVRMQPVGFSSQEAWRERMTNAVQEAVPVPGWLPLYGPETVAELEPLFRDGGAG